MITVDDGGPAFPSGATISETRDNVVVHQGAEPGMSLRDYAAIHIAAGMAELDWASLKYGAAEIAARSYQIADALLTTRKAGGEA